MKEILGIKYITDKECATRYSYSQSWFQKRRANKQDPKFMQLQGRGKVYYPLDETDKWFKDNLETSSD
jgi:predicted DNA-binding transcriptional regulator AlpA